MIYRLCIYNSWHQYQFVCCHNWSISISIYWLPLSAVHISLHKPELCLIWALYSYYYYYLLSRLILHCATVIIMTSSVSTFLILNENKKIKKILWHLLQTIRLWLDPFEMYWTNNENESMINCIKINTGIT
jgi:hypothetical protein